MSHADRSARMRVRNRHEGNQSLPQSPFPPPSAAPEAVEPASRWACEGDDFGLLRSLPLVIAFDLVVGAVIAATWIALK